MTQAGNIGPGAEGAGAAAGGQAPPVPPVPPGASVVEGARSCVKCSYNLQGLAISGVCPECGSPVMDSLKGILLQFASREYLERVNSGLSIVLNSILLMVITSVGMMVLAFLLASGGPGGGYVDYMWISQLATMGIAVLSLVGYLRFTEPDPGFVGTEPPASARQVLRIAVSAQIAISAIQVVMSLAAPGVTPVMGAAAFSSPAVLASMLLGLASLAAWGVGFFATMNYTSWMGRRVPDAFIEKRAKTYRWLLPVVYFVGACVAIGPLIALVMYWNLLDRLRKHTRAILKDGQPAKLPKMVG